LGGGWPEPDLAVEPYDRCLGAGPAEHLGFEVGDRAGVRDPAGERLDTSGQIIERGAERVPRAAAEAVEHRWGDEDQAVTLGQLNLRNTSEASGLGRHLVRPCQRAQFVGHSGHDAACRRRLASGRLDGALAQGVTTLVVGQDGQSWIGANAATAHYLNRYFTPVNGALEPVRDFGVADFAEAVTGRLVQNVAVLASQGTIRHNVTGMASGPLSEAERAAARREVEKALAEGAVGPSSGLDYL